MLLWQEYREAQPDGYGYRFCELYDGWKRRLSPAIHPAGKRLFVDYAGQTVELVDGSTGRSAAPRCSSRC